MDLHDLDDFLRFVGEEDFPIERRQMRDFNDPMQMYNDREFFARFRFPKEVVRDIIIPIASTPHRSNRGLPVPAAIQALVFLRFVATGCFQVVCGDLFGISQSKISKIVKATSMQLAHHLIEWVSMPVNNEREQLAYMQIADFPGVIGCIDCTHIPIRSPGGEMAEVYRNRKGWFSLNVQMNS